MGRRRTGLIIGNAILFAALGCDDEQDTGTPGPSGGAGGSGGVVAGAGGGEAGGGGEIGGAGGEIGGAGGMIGGAGGMIGGAGGEADAGLSDMGADDAGAGGNLVDAAFPSDAEVDMSLADAEIPDAEMPDAEIPDAEIADAEIPDMSMPDAGSSLGCIIGELCDFADQGCCEAPGADPEAICWQDGQGALRWQAVPQDFFCGCDQQPDGSCIAFCAVPGFVGIDAAHQPRRAPVRLRTLMRRRRVA